MAQGKVSVSSRNEYQNDINEVERRLVFIGVTKVAALQGVVTALSARTDLDALFNPPASVEVKSVDDAPELDASEAEAPKPKKSDSKSSDAKAEESNALTRVAVSDLDKAHSWSLAVLTAAQLNAGQGWSASFVGLAPDGDWSVALDLANKIQSFEGAVFLVPVSSSAQINAVADKMAEMENKLARYMFGMMCLAPVGEQTWEQYKTKAAEIVKGVKAERCMVVPTLLGADIGVLAGRLCHRSITIADSPMRFKTGALLGITGELPKDSAGVDMPIELLAELDSMRYSTAQDYPGEVGWYWADGNTLDSETGDYKVIEVLRPMLKACRRVYKVALPTIADRSLNSSPESVARNKSLYMKPLRDMARPVRINNVPFPGEIDAPTESSVEINWVSDKATQIFITLRPIGSQKDITIGVGVDLSRKESEGA